MPRKCLIIATEHYEDPGWRDLPGARADADALRSVLENPAIGGFRVQVLADGTSRQCRRAIEDFFSDADPDDLLLLHISCHGKKNRQNRLVLAAFDTERAYLDATGIDATFINDQIERSRSRKVVLLLDCCYSGAYNRGLQTRGGTDEVDVAEPLSGRGRVVITASTSLQYSYEADVLQSRTSAQPSVFTRAVVDGLRTGDADLDGNGHISVDELYDWVHERVRATVPDQTPTRSVSGLDGTVYLARSARAASTPLPAALIRAAASGHSWQRIGVIHALTRVVAGPDPEARAAATALLTGLGQDPDPAVAEGARQALGRTEDELLGALVRSLSLDPAPATPARPGLSATQVPGALSALRVAVDDIIEGRSRDPQATLGPHPGGAGRTVIRTLQPGARSVSAVIDGVAYPMERLHAGGVFGTVVEGSPSRYDIAADYGTSITLNDPYQWPEVFGDADLDVAAEGPGPRLWEVLGAHPRAIETPTGTVDGTNFAVWAPGAQGVRVCGDFDSWSGRAYPMRAHAGSGVWQLFIPDVREGAKYRFQLLSRDGEWIEKVDPVAFRADSAPAHCSVVEVSRYDWDDATWMYGRVMRSDADPLLIYEVHLGSWRAGLTYRELADELVTYLGRTHFTHVQFLPIAEYPFDGSLGYQPTSLFAPTNRFGAPDEFRHLVDRLHQAGIGVIVDWVGSQFPADDWALARFDGGPLYEHADTRPDAGSLGYDHGRPEVRRFLVAGALYWLESFHIDGLKINAVAVITGRGPAGVAFLQELNASAYMAYPGVMTIADTLEFSPGVTRPTHLGGLGFGYVFSPVWTPSMLSFARRTAADRAAHPAEASAPMLTAYAERYILTLPHDEVGDGKRSLVSTMPGREDERFATLRALLAAMWAHPGQKLMFMGTEFADRHGWTAHTSLDWSQLTDARQRGVLGLVSELNRRYRATPALSAGNHSPAGFRWLDRGDLRPALFAFLRETDAGEPLACVANFSAEPVFTYRLPVPRVGRWTEVLNTADDEWAGAADATAPTMTKVFETAGEPASLRLSLAALSVVWLTPLQP